MKNLQGALEESQHKALKHVSADSGMPLGQLIRKAVALLIEQHQKQLASQIREGK